MTVITLRTLPVIGSGLMVLLALVLLVAAAFIGYDGWRAFLKYLRRPAAARMDAT